MKKRLEEKINEVIETIMSKDPEDITYNEYRILDNKLSNIKWEEEQKERNKELAMMMGKTFCSGFVAPEPLPEKGE